MELRTVTISLYFLSTILQLAAFIIAINQIKKFRSHKSGWMLLSFGLLLMLFRRAHPFYIATNGGHYMLSDAIFAVMISCCLCYGLFRVRALFDHMQNQERQLDKQARYDGLTGVLSRVAILEQANISMERCIRLKKPIAMLILDVDKFKQINDQYGHAAGDHVLIDFVHTCKNALRNIDLFGRLGGDEFLAIVSETDIEIVRTIAQRLANEVANKQSVFEGNILRITTTIGVAYSDDNHLAAQENFSPSTFVDQLIRSADLNMYAAKKESGNKVFFSQDSTNISVM